MAELKRAFRKHRKTLQNLKGPKLESRSNLVGGIWARYSRVVSPSFFYENCRSFVWGLYNWRHCCRIASFVSTNAQKILKTIEINSKNVQILLKLSKSLENITKISDLLYRLRQPELRLLSAGYMHQFHMHDFFYDFPSAWVTSPNFCNIFPMIFPNFIESLGDIKFIGRTPYRFTSRSSSGGRPDTRGAWTSNLTKRVLLANA